MIKEIELMIKDHKDAYKIHSDISYEIKKLTLTLEVQAEIIYNLSTLNEDVIAKYFKPGAKVLFTDINKEEWMTISSVDEWSIEARNSAGERLSYATCGGHKRDLNEVLFLKVVHGDIEVCVDD